MMLPPRPSRETIMNAYLAALVAALSTSLNADTQVGSYQLANVNVTAGSLFLGLPIVGKGIPPTSIVTNLSPLTMSLPATANGSQVGLATGIRTSGRRVLPWDEVKEQPALFVRDADEDADYTQGQWQQLTVSAEVWIYSNLGENPAIAPITGLNNLLDALQATMAPDDPQQYRYTMGGLVFWCRISGRILKDPGDLDGQAIAKIPVEIIVP